MSLHLTVATLVEQNGRFLMVEESPDGRANVFNQPAGHVEEGESPIDAAVRETREETAWAVQPLALSGIYRWQKPGSDITYMRFCYIAKALQQDPAATLDKEIIRVHWLNMDEIRARHAQLRSPMVLRCLEDYLAGNRYPLQLVTTLV